MEILMALQILFTLVGIALLAALVRVGQKIHIEATKVRMLVADAHKRSTVNQ